MLSADKREMSEGEEETTSDDQQLGDSTDVTTSEFFHQNRFEALLLEQTNSEPERDLSSARLKVCPSCSKLNSAGLITATCFSCKTVWQGGRGGTISEFKMADPDKSILDSRFHLCNKCDILTDGMDKNLRWPVCLNEDCQDYGISSMGMSTHTPELYKFYFE